MNIKTMTKLEIRNRIVRTDWSKLSEGMSVTMSDGSKIPEATIKELDGFVKYLFNNQKDLCLDKIEVFSVAVFPNYFYRDC